ncbi:MAG TPA: MBL fold metallo-hydrolase [Ktedonobacteraceae bacterium]|nr:MBL fold metallo-hydrolase [Ktedonobacteraceae bacterium]
MIAQLDWYGCATFRLTLGEMVIFLDAYIDRIPSATGTGLRADDIDRADWIIVGHSHFDHLWGAERIARRTGATIIGSYETVRIMEQEGIPLSQMLPVGGGERIRLSPEVTVEVFPSLHSCVWTKNGGMYQPDEVCLGDLGVTYQERKLRMEEMMQGLAGLGIEVLQHLQASAQGPRDDGGSFVYLFETPEGSLLYQDTSGHWSGILHNLRPDVAILAAAGRGTIDGEPIQGTLAQFVARQADLLRSQRVILCHHDNWLPGFSVPTHVAPIREEMARQVPRTELVELDYLSAYPLFAGLKR